MAKAVFLDFEKDLGEIHKKIEELENKELETGVSENEALTELKRKMRTRTAEIYADLTPWQTAQVARHPNRPYTLDYIDAIFEDFHELHGDRTFADDQSIVGGLARLGEHAVMVIGHQKGRDTRERTRRNFGMTKPEGYRKALRLMKQAEKLAGEGKTPLLFAKGGKLLGMIAVADVIKEDSPQAIKELQNMGIRVVMLTGDNERTAKAIGAQAGVDDVIAGVLPDGKESVIRSLKEQGKVAMVGDGINDAPALTRADIGIAIGAGTDVAIDAADVVLMKSRLSDVPAAIRLSRATLRNIHENLFWAFFYNVIGIPLAAGVWIPIFGWTLNPMFGAAAMSLSSFCVVTNALRLNLFKVHDASRDKKIKQNVTETHYISDNAKMKNVTENRSLKAEKTDFCNSEIHDPKDQENIKENKENKEMTTITVNVTGMMCGHCEAHVTKAVKEAFGVEDVVSSHEKGTTVIHAPEKLDEDKIREVIKEAGYEVTGITQE